VGVVMLIETMGRWWMECWANNAWQREEELMIGMSRLARW
jgi:hypothetical protein